MAQKEVKNVKQSDDLDTAKVVRAGYVFDVRVRALVTWLRHLHGIDDDE